MCVCVCVCVCVVVRAPLSEGVRCIATLVRRNGKSKTKEREGGWDWKQIGSYKCWCMCFYASGVKCDMSSCRRHGATLKTVESAQRFSKVGQAETKL